MKIKYMLSLVFFLFCNGYADHSLANTSTTPSQPMQANAVGTFDPMGYYTFRSDLRLCPSPLCGGIFVKAVNSPLTHCPDGSLRQECYVAFVTNRNNIALPKSGLIQGSLGLKTYPAFGIFGAFDLQAAFRPATARSSSGQFFGLKNNGIMCITSPCFSYNEYLLNSASIRRISRLDFRATGASQQVLAEAYAILGNGGTLIAAGSNKQVQEFAGPGITFAATQFYLPIKPNTP